MQFRARLGAQCSLRPARRPLRLRLRLRALRPTRAALSPHSSLLSTRRDFTRTSLRPRARRRRSGLLHLLLVRELSPNWLQLVFGSTRASREATCPLLMHVPCPALPCPALSL